MKQIHSRFCDSLKMGTRGILMLIDVAEIVKFKVLLNLLHMKLYCEMEK